MIPKPIGRNHYFCATTTVVMMETGFAKVGPHIGNKAPNFTLDSLSAENVKLSQVLKENKAILINFWGIWCPYCVKEMPELVKFYNQYHKQQVEILAVNVGDNPQEVPKFTEKNQITFPVLIDKNDKISNLYQVSGFPTTFIIDAKGKIRDIIVGSTTEATLASKVDKLLQEK
jgi:peroxiredoxin